MRQKCIEINNSCYYFKDLTAYCTTVLKLNATPRHCRFHIGTQSSVRFVMWVNSVCLTEPLRNVKILLLHQVACELWGYSTEPWLLGPVKVVAFYLSDILCSLCVSSSTVYSVIVPKSVASELNFCEEMYIFFMSVFNCNIWAELDLVAVVSVQGDDSRESCLLVNVCA